MLLKNLLDRRLDFTYADANGEPLVKGQYNMFYQDDDYYKIRSEWVSFTRFGATAEQLMEQRDRARKMICMRLAVWDLEYAPGKVIPINAESLIKYKVPDDLLDNIIDTIDGARDPNSENAS